jgi:hypothetical protein
VELVNKRTDAMMTGFLDTETNTKMSKIESNEELDEFISCCEMELTERQLTESTTH